MKEPYKRKVPFKRTLLYSGIDWKTFFALQASANEEKIPLDRSMNSGSHNKVMQRVRGGNINYRGGRKK